MVDARGYSCPMPVIMVQKAVKVDYPELLEVLVDNQCAVENVTRFAQGQQYEVKVQQEGNDFRITLKSNPRVL